MHSLTTFKNVRLPRSALLGSLEAPASVHANLLGIISRVTVGTIALSCAALPAMKCLATIGTMYSLRRQIGPPARRMPILSFRTQHAPILTAAANVYMMQALQRWAIEKFLDQGLDARVRHGIAAIFKSVMIRHSQQDAIGVSERCGAQGLFMHNQIMCHYVSIRVFRFRFSGRILTMISSRTRRVGWVSLRETSSGLRSVGSSSDYGSARTVLTAFTFDSRLQD